MQYLTYKCIITCILNIKEKAKVLLFENSDITEDKLQNAIAY